MQGKLYLEKSSTTTSSVSNQFKKHFAYTTSHMTLTKIMTNEIDLSCITIINYFYPLDADKSYTHSRQIDPYMQIVAKINGKQRDSQLCFILFYSLFYVSLYGLFKAIFSVTSIIPNILRIFLSLVMPPKKIS